MQLGRIWVVGVVAGMAAIVAGAQAPSTQDIEFFEREVRPLLAQHCYDCHGVEKQKGGLRLDHIQFALQGGDTGSAVIPGKPEESPVIKGIAYDDVDFQMPPDGKLSAKEIATLTEWISRGAPWPEEPLPAGEAGGGGNVGSVKNFDLEERRAAHWSWRGIDPQVVPAVQQADWPKSDVDRFLLAKLEANGLRPAPDAEKYTLIRRLYFDLIGLPPTPEAIEAFVSDDSPDAYSKVVDELLVSPAFGERWARHWMDVTRYAETHGHEGDYPVKYAWRYRDYMIRAFNDDIPYDQLIREHLAGDLLDNPRINEETGTSESVLATAFLFMHQATHAPVDAKQDYLDRMDNGIDVISKGFLGMTVACARCHQHPFDAISTYDYYALVGALRSSRQTVAYLDPHGKIGDGAAKMREVHTATNESVKASLAAWLGENETKLAPYLEATREVMTGAWQPEDGVEALAPDIYFEDFESGYRQWHATGDAFARGPSKRPAEGQEGEFTAASHAGDDKKKGTLTSRPFVVDRKFVHLMVSGGYHAKNLVVNFVVDGESVRNAGGTNSNQMRRVRWDVSEFEGKEASIEIVDKHSGPWGQIAVDAIVFSDSHYVPGLVQRPIAAVAKESDLDTGMLARWVDVLGREGIGSPLDSWVRSARIDGDEIEKTLEAPRPAKAEVDEFVLYEDFASGTLDGWFREGEAFTPGIVERGTWTGGTGHTQFSTGDVIHSGIVANKLQGTIRSPSFTLTHDNIHLRVSGWGCKVRLVVEGYQLREFNGILFGQTLFDVNSPNSFYWHNMTRDLQKFKGSRAYLEFIDDGDGFIIVDEIRFSDGAPPASQFERVIASGDGIDSHEALAKTIEQRVVAAAQRVVDGTSTDPDGRVLGWLLDRDLIAGTTVATTLAEGRDAMNQIAATLPTYLRVTAVTEGTPEDSPYLIRGNHGTPGEEIERRFLEAIAGKDQPPVKGSGRLEITERLLADGNPFPSRVAVNRVWHHLFGAGIVETTDNFGVTGDTPSHPELLDYLAAKFRDDGWSMKGLIRELVHTRAYRMTSQPLDKVAEEKDPANELLHRMRVRRLQGEAIRDAVLASAGTLDETMYGESVPTYLSPFMTYHRRPARSGPMDGDRRRTIYTEIRRNFLNPMLLAFDMPQPDSTVGRRNVSNVPAQALIMMNDPFVVQQAEEWAKSITKEDGPVEAKIERMFMRALGRVPSDGEVERMKGFMTAQAETYEISAERAINDRRVWKDLCHVMFTLKEFVYVL